ncbi:hypothetical protein PR048_025370 [Dryococelus australis]|uniref:Uncharacterized protein n=1 Tax=Dryococelus australis TaxID=614101 RepID=A0ABQ9GR26_9NEOP|nr:hypothetical protein PR048_025370 [Dryococelus australis]
MCWLLRQVWSSDENKGRGKREIPEKTRRSTAGLFKVFRLEPRHASLVRILHLDWGHLLDRSLGNMRLPAPKIHIIHKGRGGVVVSLLASRQGEPRSIPGGVAPGLSHVGIVPDDAAERPGFLGDLRFFRSFIPALPHTHLASPTSALKTSILSATQMSSCTRSHHPAGRGKNDEREGFSGIHLPFETAPLFGDFYRTSAADKRKSSSSRPERWLSALTGLYAQLHCVVVRKRLLTRRRNRWRDTIGRQYPTYFNLTIHGLPSIKANRDDPPFKAAAVKLSLSTYPPTAYNIQACKIYDVKLSLNQSYYTINTLCGHRPANHPLTSHVIVARQSCEVQVKPRLCFLVVRISSMSRHMGIIHETETERGGAVVAHWTRIWEKPRSIPGPALMISAFHGFPKSLQANAGIGPKQRSSLIPSESFRNPTSVPAVMKTPPSGTDYEAGVAPIYAWGDDGSQLSWIQPPEGRLQERTTRPMVPLRLPTATTIEGIYL